MTQYSSSGEVLAHNPNVVVPEFSDDGRTMPSDHLSTIWLVTKWNWEDADGWAFSTKDKAEAFIRVQREAGDHGYFEPVEIVLDHGDPAKGVSV